ncbi:unnamed protein product, partial [Amoebophrya sp. A120]|eukprot:GSA120T00018358001.1
MRAAGFALRPADGARPHTWRRKATQEKSRTKRRKRAALAILAPGAQPRSLRLRPRALAAFHFCPGAAGGAAEG